MWVTLFSDVRSKALSPMLTLLGLQYLGPLWVFQCFSGNTSYHRGLEFSLNLVLLPIIIGNTQNHARWLWWAPLQSRNRDGKHTVGALHITCRGEVLRQLWVQGRGWQQSFGKFILVDFKPHGMVVTTVACQWLCYDTFWKQFDDVLACLPKVCCLCTMINHTAHTVIALLDTRH